MVLFYVVLGGIMLIFSSLFFLNSELIRKMMKFVLDRDLFFLIGVIEIACGLGVLYYRHQTRFKLFVYIIGYLFFIDGIMYLISTKRVKETYSWFIDMEPDGYRAYAMITLLISVGLIVAGIY